MQIVVLLGALLAIAAAFYFLLGTSRKQSSAPIALRQDAYQPFKLIERHQVSPNTVLFRFALPTPQHRLGLPVGRHITLRATDADGKPFMRPYTPVSSDADLGHFDLLVKLYPTGKMSQRLQSLQVGESLDVRGPLGSLEYVGSGKFHITHASGTKEYDVASVGMIAGGSGITPMMQLLRDVHKHATTDHTRLSLLYANVSEADILLHSELEELRETRSLTQVHYTLDRPGEGWTGYTGFVTPDMIKKHLPAPAADTLILLCGPKPMVDSMERHLKTLGYQDEMIFKF